VRFALPADMGDVRVGIAVDDDLLARVLTGNAATRT